jgi:hypothetical protein
MAVKEQLQRLNQKEITRMKIDEFLKKYPTTIRADLDAVLDRVAAESRRIALEEAEARCNPWPVARAVIHVIIRWDGRAEFKPVTKDVPK